QHCLIKSSQALPRVGPLQIMFCVWNVSQMFFLWHLRIVELRVVRQEELVARSVDQVLRNLQPLSMSVLIWIFYRQNVLILRRAYLVWKQLVMDVVLQRGREEAICLIVMPRDDLRVQRVDHQRNDCHYSLVFDRSEPGGPSALGSAGNHKL